jgi:hypothetical protein
MKARAALYMSDWKTCAEAAKACMDLGVYSLHPDFGEFFLSKTKTSPELIFALPCSNELGIMLYDAAGVNSFYIRNAGGTSVAQPSWELFFAFTCTDGLNVEDSPLYDPANPFANRDPRLAATTVEFGSAFLDYIYDPRPSATKTLQVSTGQMVNNKDCKPGSKDCSYNGLVLRKHVDEEWIDDKKTDAPARIEALNAKIKEYAKENKIPYVDYYTPMVTGAERALNPDYSKDGVHPTLEGYLVMEALIKPAIEKAL